MLNSDSEDEEYIPDEKADSSSSSESETEKPDAKRSRRELSEAESSEAQQRKQKEMWRAFKESVASGESSLTSERAVEKPKTIRVEKRYIYAGKETTEVIEVPVDSVEAKKWPTVSSEPLSGKTNSIPSPAHDPDSNASSNTDHLASATIFSTPSPAQISQKTVLPRRGPRKPKITLGEIPGSSSGSRSRPTKLTTLEKSAMDWRSHISEQDSVALKDELEANRKQGGGGYLEKVEFLERVSERRENLLDASKSGKRRRR
ncbi:bucentaur or craniofacial development-domain-containing protein [Lentinula aff. detonsa]|uniref:SWR1-complex protein 5 n=1 Tax=Lentinula aff. detonsa TaxID=2804958 RepID=A0AA38NJ73_9AGAR|nr:bucentaur or craniofacial development-domain-containing protein [Lentinula aff. detonsa]